MVNVEVGIELSSLGKKCHRLKGKLKHTRFLNSKLLILTIVHVSNVSQISFVAERNMVVVVYEERQWNHLRKKFAKL